MPYKLWEHQKHGRDFMLARTHALMAYEPATGKTLMSLALFKAIQARIGIVIGPISAIHVWSDQVSKFHPELVYLNLAGVSSANKLKILKNKHIFNSPTLVGVNYEGLRDENVLKALIALNADVIFADEAHRLGDARSKQSKAAAKLGATIPRRYALTGTPWTESPTKLYGIFKFLDKTVFPYKLMDFRTEFESLVPLRGRIGVYMSVGPRNLDKLGRIIQPHTDILKAKDAIELPKEQHIPIQINFNADTTKEQYKQLLKKSFLELQEGTLVVNNVITTTLRLQEYTAGFVRLPGGPVWQNPSKLSAVADLLEDFEEPVVIFYRYTPEAEIYTWRLKRNKLYLWNGKTRQLDEWRKDPKGVLLVQVDSGSEAEDLTHSRIAVFTSLPYSNTVFTQAKARISRPTSDMSKPVVYYYMNTVGTIDETIYKALQEKGRIEQVLYEYVVESSNGTD